MKVSRFLRTACALALGLAVIPAVTEAQGPLYDKVLVNLPYTVTVGEHVLQPGPYMIRQVDSPGGASRVLLIYSNDGRQFETSAMTIPALDPTTADNTKVVLHHFGPDYYFDKIWIQGKDYGYEFPLPDAVKARQRERMAPLTVAATYEAVPKEEVAQAPAPAPVQETPAPQPEVAQAPPPAPEPQATPAPAPVVAERRMPETASGWLMMLLGGGALSGLGLALRRQA
ncbi:MAG TPA: hypothetical protein VN442_22575 [Bryobacteraceae bacterium]|nr:hypothetical protein [Bryobacteraceae bacterium]